MTVIFVSNRAPIEHSLENGSLIVKRGNGGLVTALRSATSLMPCVFIASPITEGDRVAAEKYKDSYVPSDDENLHLRYVQALPEQYEDYYNKIANPMIWFAQHSMWDAPRTPDINKDVWNAWHNGYIAVSQAFADMIVEEARKVARPLILLQDYQLSLVGAYVRQRFPGVLIGHFMHIPWPGPSYWRFFPQEMVLAILNSLLSCNIIGFQTKRDGTEFLATCAAYEEKLPGLEIDYKNRVVATKRGSARVRAYPISIDAAETQRIANSPEAQSAMELFKQQLCEKTIIRVDRLDPSKNILRGLWAYDGLLARYGDELRERVSFLTILVPSREDIIVYKDYRSDVEREIAAINNRYGNENWKPIHFFMGHDYARALAAMRIYDVLLVNPIADGMNLVAKEGPIVNEKNGVLILSQTAGAYDELRGAVLGVAPFDTEGTVETLYAGLKMPEEQKKNWNTELRAIIEKNNIQTWLTRQLNDLSALS